MKILGVLIVAISAYAICDGMMSPKDVKSALQSIVFDPNKSTTQQINEVFPQNVLKHFTLAFDSRSAQKEGVSCEWPRVIRFSDDGRTIVSYNCNPKAPTAHEVESILFDDQAKLKHYVHTDLQKEGNHRNELNPNSCLKCHGKVGADYQKARYNWAKYPIWPGFFGGKDDRLNGGQNGVDEMKCWAEFKARRLAKGNENSCYDDLPWPTINGQKKYDHKFRRKDQSYAESHHLKNRTNLRLGNLLVRLQAQSLTQRIKNHPAYELLKYIVAADRLQCLGDKKSDFTNELKKLGISLRPGEKQYLTQLSHVFDINAFEWSLMFSNRRFNSYYHTGSSDTIHGYTGAALLAALIQDGSFKAERDLWYKDVDFWGDYDRQCINSLGMELKENSGMKKEAVCQNLLAKHYALINNQNLIEKLKPYLLVSAEAGYRELEIIERGKKYFEESCLTCHSSSEHISSDLVFTSDQAIINMREEMNEEMNASRMPKDKVLSIKEKAAIKAYLYSLSD